MNYYIDRFENDIAVCYGESKQKLIIKKCELYQDPNEGDWFELLEGKAIFLKDLTEKKRNKNIELLSELTR